MAGFDQRVNGWAVVAQLMLVFAVAQVSSPQATAQELTIAEQKEQIADLYQLTKTATTAKDYTHFVGRCQELSEKNISQKNQAYLKSLIAWGLNRRGEKRLDSANLFLTAGNIEQGDQALVSAAVDFEEATKSDPKRGRAWLCRGVAEVKQQNFEDAITSFTKAIELNPKDSNAYFNRAEAYNGIRQFQKAIEDYDFVLEVHSGDLQALTGRGHCFYGLAEYQKAFADYDGVVGLAPNDPVPLLNRGDAHQMLGHWQDAYHDYMASINLKATGEGLQKAALMLATCPEASFLRPQESLELCQRAMEAGFDQPALLETRAAAESANGNFDEAQHLQERAKALTASIEQSRQVRIQRYKQAALNGPPAQNAKLESTEKR